MVTTRSMSKLKTPIVTKVKKNTPKYQFDDYELWTWLQDVRLRPLISEKLGTESTYEVVSEDDKTSVHWISRTPKDKGVWWDSVLVGVQPYAINREWVDVKCAFYSLYHEMQYKHPKLLPNLLPYEKKGKRVKTPENNYLLLKKMLRLLGEYEWFYPVMKKSKILWGKGWTRDVFKNYWGSLVNESDWGV